MSGPYGPPPGSAPQGPGAPGSYAGPPGPGPQGAPGYGPGQPGGYQGQGGWGGGSVYAPAKPRPALGLDKILALTVAALGLLNFIWGFLPAVSLPTGTASTVPTSFYGLGYGYLPVLLFASGLLALGPLVPKGRSYSFPVAVVSVVVAIAAVASWLSNTIFTSQTGTGKGIGLILLGIFAILQALAALGAWLTDSGVVKQGGRPAGGFAPSGHGGPAQGYQPQGGFGGQPGPGAGQPGPGPYGPGPQGQGPQGQGPQGPAQPGGPSAPAPSGRSSGATGAQFGQFGPGQQAGEPSFGAQGGYAPQSPVAPGEASGGFPRPSSDGDDGDDGQHPDVTQQVRF